MANIENMGPGTAQRINAEMAESANDWNNRFGEAQPAPSIQKEIQSREIHRKINQRADEKPLTGEKAVRGTGEGFWSQDARSERTHEHFSNWTEGNGRTAMDSIKNGEGVRNPYSPSRLHAKRESGSQMDTMQQRIEPQGDMRLPADRPQA